MEIEFPAKLQCLFRPGRYKVAYGGRGSGKSWGFARALLLLGMQRKERVLCAREVQKSIKDSVHALVRDQIEALGLGGFYDVQRDEIRGRNGTLFLFAGLREHTVESIKSYEGITRCWVEEAQTVSDRSWAILIPTIRAEGSEIWLSFNPDLEDDPTYQRFVVHPPEGAILIPIGWQDNPWFPEVLRVEKDDLYRRDPEAAAHVWGGECRRNSDAQVLRGRYVVESFEPEPHWDGPYQGADWGFAADPTCLIRCYIWERKLYIRHEAYGHGVEIDHTPALFDAIPGAREVVTRADSARPETISYMIRNGWKRMEPARKWPGSVEDGVEHLRSYDQIVIHPECPHIAQEARLWSFKTDRLSGDVLPRLVDANNHGWDAVRYALQPIILSGAGKQAPHRPSATKAPSDWMAF